MSSSSTSPMSRRLVSIRKKHLHHFWRMKFSTPSTTNHVAAALFKGLGDWAIWGRSQATRHHEAVTKTIQG